MNVYSQHVRHDKSYSIYTSEHVAFIYNNNIMSFSTLLECTVCVHTVYCPTLTCSVHPAGTFVGRARHAPIAALTLAARSRVSSPAQCTAMSLFARGKRAARPQWVIIKVANFPTSCHRSREPWRCCPRSCWLCQPREHPRLHTVLRSMGITQAQGTH